MNVRAKAAVAPLPVVSPSTPWDLARTPRIPVARPRLAPLEAALPYLKRIDQARIYSNYGPLNALFEARLAERFGLAEGCVVTCANATIGLTLALQAAANGEPGLCIMPAWTFAATAHAAIAAGLTPFLADVDPATGALTPELARQALVQAPGRVAALMPVAPYGQPLDLATWRAFEAASGVGVVIDAAAGFDALKPGPMASVVSLHATKVLGIGEGGFVIAEDPALIADVRRRANFGFDGQRDASLAGGNGKLSEYGAAVGLAALDLWGLQRAEYQSALGYYRAALADAPGVKIAEGLGEAWVCSTFCIEVEPKACAEIERRLTRAEIATRRWWGKGLAGHRAFGDLPRMDLPVTERLAASTLGLPCWPGISAEALDEIVQIVRDVVGRP